MFERFTGRARESVALAQDEARALKHNYIGTEHLLLGLLRVEEGLAARVLESLGVRIEQVRAEVERVVGVGSEATAGQIPFTDRAKRALELALREALRLGHNYIGTEHVLLGLCRVEQGVAAEILRGLDAGPEKVWIEVVRLLSGPAGFPSPDSVGVRRRRARGFPKPPLIVQGPPPKQQSPWQTLLTVAVGWLLFGLASGAGLVVGWLIWG